MENQEVVIPTEEVESKSKPTRALAVKESGAVALNSLSDQLAFAKSLMQQELVSSTFKTPQQVVVAFQYAKAMKMPELLAIKQMYVVNGRPCLWGDGPLALCQRSGKVASIEEFFLDEKMEIICVANRNLNAKVYAAITRIRRAGDTQTQEDYFTLDDMKRAGVDSSKFGKKDVWAKYERNMLRYRARSMSLKTKFADMIMGIGIAEYDFNFSPETPEIVATANTFAEELTERYAKEEAAPMPELTQ